ncbi:MAG TPA: SAM-dependent methyltransferase [Clostridia bacterium]|jgi:tRNA (adenine22-N1)-methyltransferase|nr:SAM-dependent methyltransferase [Clostridia bacterium]
MFLKEQKTIIKLSPRLQAVAELVKPGLKLADIGTDHAYLPIYLIQQGKSPLAVAIDIHRGPYESALKQVALQGLEDKITVILGNGLEPLQPGQVDVVVLAGMGSATMIEILEAKPELVLKLQQLVLQPMVGVGQMRKWLVENGWAINNEILVKDDGFIYTVLSALPGEQSISDWLTLELGPILLKEKPPLLKDYISKMLSDYENVLINLAQTQSQEVKQKRLDLLEKINLLKGVISSGFKG